MNVDGWLGSFEPSQRDALLLIDVISDLAFEGSQPLVVQADSMALRLARLSLKRLLLERWHGAKSTDHRLFALTLAIIPEFVKWVAALAIVIAVDARVIHTRSQWLNPREMDDMHNRNGARQTGRWRSAVVAALLITSAASPAFAQNYSFDARRIALGGAGGTPNVATKLVERQRRYKSILIPVGLVKMLSDFHVFYPNREDFDFTRAVEFAASPLHFTFGRSDDITPRSFFRDIVHASLQPDLNAYSGFEMPVMTDTEGLVSLTWGKTFMLQQDDRSFQGIYVGAGPYLASKAFFEFDSELERILSGSGDRYVPFASLGVGGGEINQLALDITGSYRARFPLFAPDGAGASRNGMYVAANYHHLQGFRYDSFDAGLQLDTDTNGLLVPDPPERPFLLDWNTSSKGIGLSMDFGVAFVVNRWDFGAGVSGVANRIKWRDITQHEVSLVSLFNNVEFVHIKRPRTNLTAQVEMPVTYTGDISYHRDQWSAYTEYSNGLGGTNFRTGLEYRLGAVEIRGAGRYSNGDWYPSLGAGFNFTRSFAVDAALFGTQTFLEPKPHVGLAISFRLDRR